MTTFSDAFAQTYTYQRQVARTRVARKPRKPVLVVLGTVLATVAAWIAVRVVKGKRAIIYTVGFGFIDFGIFGWNHLVGYAAIGVSLLILEMLSGGDEQ
jgi:hypothetical protein